MSLSQNLIKKFERNISSNIKLSNYSWFNLGGPAEYFFKPEDENQLIEFLKDNQENKIKITILGAGSNTLIRDNGVKGVVIKLGSNFSNVKLINKDTLEVGAATLDRKVANFAKDNGIGNLEFLSCIPGTIGGAVTMNSGCYGNDISKVLISLNAIDINQCKKIEIKKEDIEFSYRGTNLSNKLIIISAKLKGKVNSKDSIEKIQNELIEKKKFSQPSQIKTCGSTFKNMSEERKAWKLIESGCGISRRRCCNFKKHCNFFVNNGKAKSSDIEKLINKVKKTVNDKAGVDLELEIKIVGE